MSRFHSALERAEKLLRYLEIGISSTDAEIRRRQRFVNIAAVAGVLDNALHTASNMDYDPMGLMPLVIYGIVMMVLFGITPIWHRFGDIAGAIYIVLVMGVGHLFVVWTIGTASAVHAYYTLGGASFLFFGVRYWRVFAVVLLFAVALLAVSMKFAPEFGTLLIDDRAFHNALGNQVLMSVLIIYSILIVYALTSLHFAEAALAAEHERSETLLETILPRAIADRLKANPDQRIADLINPATVLFVDIVGFTPAARQMTPDEVVGYLDQLFRQFDRLVEYYGAEKIKTIGDAYMVIGGVDQTGTASARSVGHLALDLMELVQRQPPFGTVKLNLRCGIHSGKAIAGVIGRRRYSFDIWGDAVNVAARMESHSEPGKIQVTEEFMALAPDEFEYLRRGSIEVKGVGPMPTAFLTGARHASTPEAEECQSGA